MKIAYTSISLAYSICNAIAMVDVATHRNLRINGGVDIKFADKAEFVVRLTSSISNTVCTGSLIAPNVVLTSAQCSNIDQVEIGRFNLDDNEADYATFQIVEYRVHPNFSMSNLDYDAMLIHLDGNSAYKPVSIDDGTQEFPRNTRFIVMGWGDNTGEQSGTVKKVTVRKKRNQVCKVKFGNNVVTSRMICASGRNGKGVCDGDSDGDLDGDEGGPLVKKSSGVLVGIVSRGGACGNPGLYTAVGIIYPWIVSILNEWVNVEPTKSPTLAPSSLADGSLLSIGDTFTYDLPGAQDSYSTNVVIIDLFDTSTDNISNLKAEGHTVICYFSAGSWENWREDADQFPSVSLGKNLDGWPGEKWLDTRNGEVREIMKNRILLAKSKGCQGVEADNLDGYGNNTGFNLSKSNSINYISFLAMEAHNTNLVIALKNSAEIVSSVQPVLDFAIVESCYEYDECCLYEEFISNGKPIFSIEYTNYNDAICTEFQNHGFSLIFGNYDLDELTFCPGITSFNSQAHRSLSFCAS